jgi:cytochrome b
MVRVWDIFVRFSHWSVALGFFIAYFTEDDLLALHVWAGYVVGVFVVMRVLWGFIGPRHARFSDFLYGPHKVFTYLRDLIAFRAERHLGHSPAGGAMAIALWIGLLAIVWSGLELYAAEEGAGPLAAIRAEVVAPPAAAGGLLVLVSEHDDDDEDDDEDEGRRGEGRGEGDWEDIHEVLANLVLLLVILHIAGVILAGVVHRENLARAMVTGMKRQN